MVGPEVVNLFVEGARPKVFADEDDGVQLILEPRCVPGHPLYHALSNPVSQPLQLLGHIRLEVGRIWEDELVFA